MKEVGDKFGAGELILPFVLQSAEVMKKSVAHLEQYLDQRRRRDQGQGRAGDGLRRCARHRQESGQHDPVQQRLHRVRPGQAGAAQHDHRQGRGSRGRRDRSVGAAGLDLQADAAVRAGAAQARPELSDPGRRRGDQSPVWPAHLVRVRRCTPTSRACSTARMPSRVWKRWIGCPIAASRAAFIAAHARRKRSRRMAQPERGRTVLEKVGRVERGKVRVRTCAPMSIFRRHRSGVRKRTRASGWTMCGLAWTSTRCSGCNGARRTPRARNTANWSKQSSCRNLRRFQREAIEQGWLQPAVVYGFFPVQSAGQDLIVYDPADRTTRTDALLLPAPAGARPAVHRRLLRAGRQWTHGRGGLPARDDGTGSDRLHRRTAGQGRLQPLVS